MLSSRQSMLNSECRDNMNFNAQDIVKALCILGLVLLAVLLYFSLPKVVTTSSSDPASNEELQTAICFEHPDNELCYQEPPPPEDCTKPKANTDDFGYYWVGNSILDNDDDGGCQVNITVTRQPYNGILDIHPDGTFDYIPVDGYQGAESFRYNLTNNWGRGNTSTVNFLVGDGTPPPIDPCDADPTASGCPCPESDEVYPNCPVDPPVDPNEPTPPDCLVPDCPMPPQSYYPEFPPLGEYSVEGACEAIANDDTPTVTLGDGEELQAAYLRLTELTGNTVGRMVIPWDTETVQCDKLRLVAKGGMREFTMSGTVGPEGQLPRFYCRKDDRGGTIPHDQHGGTFIQGSNYDKLLVEQIHVDGYGQWAYLGTNGNSVIRNSYFNSATNNGFANSNIVRGDDSQGAEFEFCGVETSHAGNGNVKHCFYIHRSQVPGVDIKMSLIDSDVHSCNWSSGLKSIANINRVVNNRFSRWRDTEPTLPRRHSQMLGDIAACSDTVLDGNQFPL